MYQKAYYEADALSKAISSGNYSKPETQRVDLKKYEGIIPRPSMERDQDNSSQGTTENMGDDLMMQYFMAVREQAERLQNDLHNPTDSSGGTNIGTPVVGDVGRAREALASVESKGSGDYSAVGPEIKKGSYKGDRAYGRYQVMGKNIGPWTKQILGREYTPEEFLKDHAAQDKVVEYRLQQSYDKYGSWEDAASVWFSGGPLSTNAQKSDGYIDTAEYISRFQRAYART